MAAMDPATSGRESDLEQGALLGGDRSSQRTRPLSLVSAVLLVAVAIVCAFRLSKFPGSIEVQDGSAATRWGRPSGVVQAYAMERGGRALTDGDFEILYSRMDETRHPRAKALMNRFLMRASPGPHKQDDVEQGLSDACANAIQDKLKEALQSFAKLLVDMFFGCAVAGEGSQGCRAAEARIDSFPEDLTAKCEQDGDFCNISAVEMEGGKQVDEAETVCVPVPCHQEAKKAIEFFRDQMGEHIEMAQAEAQAGGYSLEEENAEDCGNCTVRIECGAGGLAGGALAQDARQLVSADRLAYS